jgi:glycosyltransferase involved in cell wall biosynthesis
MLVLHVDPAPTWRGGERQVLLLAQGLARDGVRNVLAVDPRGVLRRRAEEARLDAVSFRARGDADPFAVLRALRILRAVAPDLLHLHTARAHGAFGLAARLAGFHPVLVTRRVELPARGPLGRWKYRRLADHYVAISSAVESALLDAGVAPSRITRIPSGVEIPTEPARRSGGGAWTVGTLAAFTAQKDPATWLETVRRVAAEEPGATFVWAGDGELRHATEVAVARAGLAARASFPGFLDDPGAFWSGIDVFFLPSAFEAMGTVFLDAMARGIPVVATRVGGIPEIVGAGREGLLAARGDAEALARALLELRRDPGRARALGEAGRRRARAFDVADTTRRTRDLYERLLAGTSR